MKSESEDISKKFGKLIMETRLAGHAMYFVQAKGKWCLRFNYIYRDAKSVAFFEDSSDEVLEKGIEFIENNRIKDCNDEYRPYKME